MHRNNFIEFLLVIAAFALNAESSRAQSLDGVWEITTVIDNGRVVEPTEVLLNYAADGRVVIRHQQVELLVPKTYNRKVLAFMVDNPNNPTTIYVFGADYTGGCVSFIDINDTIVL